MGSEIGPPSSGRSWADVRARLLLVSAATLSRLASLQLLDTYLRLHHSLRTLIEDPNLTRRQLRELVTGPGEEVRRQRVAADRARYAQRRALIERAGQRQAGAAPRQVVAGRDAVSDDDIVGRSDWTELLEAVADGRVLRGTGDETSMFAPYLLDGDEVRTPLRALVRYELIRMPLSGRPELLPRGERIVARIRQRGQHRE